MGELHMLGRSPRGLAGFTMTEVLIVIAIVAILTAVAYPSYTSYVTRANRNAAQGFLLEVSNRQERFLLDHRRYATAIGTATGQVDVTIPNSVSANYTVTTNVPSARAGAPATSFDVVATPIGRQLANDAACGTLAIDDTGQKSVTGSAGRASCWRD